MTLNDALQALQEADPTEITPDQIAWMIESVEFVLAECQPCFAGKRTIIKLSGSLRCELEDAERRSIEIPDDGDDVDAAWTFRS